MSATTGGDGRRICADTDTMSRTAHAAHNDTGTSHEDYTGRNISTTTHVVHDSSIDDFVDRGGHTSRGGLWLKKHGMNRRRDPFRGEDPDAVSPGDIRRGGSDVAQPQHRSSTMPVTRAEKIVRYTTEIVIVVAVVVTVAILGDLIFRYAASFR